MWIRIPSCRALWLVTRRSPSPSWGGTARRSRTRVGNASPARAAPGFRLPHPDRYAIVPLHFGGGRTTGHDSSPLADKRSGRARGGRASPGANVFYRFDETDRPRSRFPRALRLAALTFGPRRIIRRTRCRARRGADLTLSGASGPLPAARGEQAEAIHRPPRGPPDSPPPGLHRSTTARRHRGVGSDALPTDGMDRLWKGSRLWRANDAVIFGSVAKSKGCRSGIC